MSTQDRAVRGEEAAQQEGLEGEGTAAAGNGALDPARMRAMQRRWIQRKASGGGGGAAAIPSGGGAPLGGGVQSRMEKTLGADLGGVRVHTGGESAEAAESLGARAFTVGSDVHFGRGEFAPGSKEGDRLLAHELTHVVQGQKSGVQRKADAAHGDSDGGEHGDHEAGGHEVSEPGDASEKEADAMGDHAAEKLHGDSDKGGGEHGGGEHGGGSEHGEPAGGKKVSRQAKEKPAVGQAPAGVSRKIYLAKDPAKASTSKSAPTTASPGAKPGATKDQAKALPPSAVARIQVINKALEKDVTDRSLAVILKSAQTDLDGFAKEYPEDTTVKDLKTRFDGKRLGVETAFKTAVTTAAASLTKIDATKPESYDVFDALVKDPALLGWISHPLFPNHELVTAWVKARDDKGHAFADAKKNALTKAKAGISAAPDKSESRNIIDGLLSGARPFMQSKSPYYAPLVAEVQDAYIAKLQSIGTVEHAEQERKAKEREKGQHEKQQGGGAPNASATGASGPLAAKPADQKDASGGASATGGGKKDHGDVHAQGGKEAGKPEQKPAPAAAPTPAAAAPTGAQHGPDAQAAAASPGATPHAPSPDGGAHVDAKGHDAGKSHDPAKHHAEEEKEKLEEERRKNEEEQLEAEIELLCQQALHHIAEGNAAVGAACDIGSVAFPPAAAILHPVAALKSLGAAGLSLRAEYQEKWLSLAIKHMTPEQVEGALVKLQKEITTIGGLRKAIEQMLGESEAAKVKLEMKGKPKKTQQAAQPQPAAEEEDESGDAKKHSKHSPRAQVVGGVAKDEGGELGAEAGGTVGVKLAESLAHSIGEGAGATLLENLGHMMHNVLPWVGTGLAADKVRTTGDKIKDLKRKLWVLQELGKDMGAKTGKPVDLPK